ncbi:hypothetical protein [Frigoribacterium sp. CG_9.8]|uniref:hypothetical protein n=1 Tax=Frigoribacterium sp. CG_9.8 TaxID=2787733 RepID=UPI0018CB6537|nr:hypothetical protein [Frigoribacterium sp. CG_9.8]MBG6106579.1 hypothetical protein [Frigoribacterium sp. CG_9.8]
MCEDYPCCGHEPGDCNGQLYGSDESIKNDEMARMIRNDRYAIWGRMSQDDY